MNMSLLKAVHTSNDGDFQLRKLLMFWEPGPAPASAWSLVTPNPSCQPFLTSACK